jgi:3-dehydroquinate dehydratase-1
MSYKTCVSITEKTPLKLVHTLSIALKKSDYAELRLDFLKPAQVPDALEMVKKRIGKCVCTLRPKSEGGKFSGAEKERISILKLISEYRPHLLDVEYNTLAKNKNLFRYIKKSNSEILVSWHDFRNTPARVSLTAKLKKMKKLSKNIKIVTLANSINDASRVLSLYTISSKINLIAFAMGDFGKMSRLLCLYLGSPFTYVSLGKPVAPGQFSLDEIKSIIQDI